MRLSLGRPAAKAILLLATLTFPIPSIAAEPLSGNFLADVIAISKPHRDSLAALLKGRRGLPSWVRNMVSQPRYVALASERFDIAGQAMQRFRACQPGRCEDSRIWVLYSADGKRVVARVADEELGETLFGDPSVEELQALQR